MSVGFGRGVSPPDMIIIPYLPPNFNSQNTQNTGKIMIKICAKYLLTKLPGRGIMVNSAARIVSGRAIIAHSGAVVNRFCEFF